MRISRLGQENREENPRCCSRREIMNRKVFSRELAQESNLGFQPEEVLITSS